MYKVEEVLSIIDGMRNGDIRVLFKVTNIIHSRRTKSSQKTIRKKRERCVIPSPHLFREEMGRWREEVLF